MPNLEERSELPNFTSKQIPNIRQLGIFVTTAIFLECDPNDPALPRRESAGHRHSLRNWPPRKIARRKHVCSAESHSVREIEKPGLTEIHIPPLKGFDRPALTTPAGDGKKAKRLNFLEDLLIKHPSALKRHRQSLKKRARNTETKSRLRTLIKRARQAIETKNQASAASQLRAVDKALGKAVSKGIIKGNTASRWLSRLSRSASQVSTGG